MPSQPIPMEPSYIIDLFIKRRWVILIPFFFSIIVGMYLTVYLPRIYEAETLILVEPQRVPSDYVKSIVSSDISARVNTISQQIMSRTNLEKIINDFRLFDSDEWQNAFLEDKLLSLRKRITVEVINQRYGADAFKIKFIGSDPEKVAKVANALSTYFIDENLKVRESQAIGTSSFLDSEMEGMRKRLEEKEQRLREYKKKHMGGLPEQLQTNLRILDSLQVQKNEKQSIIREIEHSIYTLQNELSLIDSLGNGLNMDEFEISIDGNDDASDSIELVQLKEKLAQLKLKYTDKHPDVLHINRMINQLETNSEKLDTIENSQPDNDNGPQLDALLHDPNVEDSQITELRLSLVHHKTELREIDNQIVVYQRRIEDTPQREQELLSIRRDYENLQGTYESLLKRKLEAEIAVNMERNQKGEQFKILDPARMPEKPIKPNLKRLYILSVGIGIALGCGIIFLIEFFDKTFKRPEDIQNELNILVLCTLPKIISPRKKKWVRIEKVAFVVIFIFSMVILGGYTFLTQKGVEKTLTTVNTITN